MIKLIVMKKIPYPPCMPGIFSEKPVRHNFQIQYGKDGNPQLQIKTNKHGEDIYYYHVCCKRCGLIDPSPPGY